MKLNPKIYFAIISFIFLSAGCSLFGSTQVSSGVAKSVNGGADWEFSNSIKNNKNATLSQVNVSKMAFDPQKRETVFVGTFTDGLFKSEDSGASWTNILSKIGVYDVVINPGDPNIIFAAGMYGDQGMMLKTTDGGASWQQVYNESAANNAVRAIALNPGSPNQMVIGTALGNVIKSSDSGLSWQLVYNFDDQVNSLQWRQDGIYVLLKTKGVYKGQIAGGDFTQLSSGISKSTGLDYLYTETMTYNQLYVDPIASSLLYVTTSRGLFKSTDGGANWSQQALPVPKDKAVVHSVQVAPTSSNIVFANVGGVIYKSTDGGNSWQTQNIVTTGYVNYILVDPSLPQIVYAGLYVPSQ